MEGYGIAYLYDTTPEPSGFGGGYSAALDAHSDLIAIDVSTGKVRWKHIPKGQEDEGGGISGGILTTAGGLLFTGDSKRLTAFDPENGSILWSQPLGSRVSNGPSTWTLEGRQSLIVGAGDTLYAFTLPSSQ